MGACASKPSNRSNHVNLASPAAAPHGKAGSCAPHHDKATGPITHDGHSIISFGADADMSFKAISPHALRFFQSSEDQYVRLMQDVVKQNPSLKQLLREVRDSNQSGSQAVAVQAPIESAGNQTGWLVLTLRPCMWAEASEAQPVPCVSVEHVTLVSSSLPRALSGARHFGRSLSMNKRVGFAETSSLPDATTRPEPMPKPNTALVLAASNANPTLLTICTLDGLQVLYQNSASRVYAGCLTGKGASSISGVSLLQKLFNLQPAEVLEDVLKTVECGQVWTRVVQVPHTLSNYQTENSVTHTSASLDPATQETHSREESAALGWCVPTRTQSTPTIMCTPQTKNLLWKGIEEAEDKLEPLISTHHSTGHSTTGRSSGTGTRRHSTCTRTSWLSQVLGTGSTTSTNNQNMASGEYQSEPPADIYHSMLATADDTMMSALSNSASADKGQMGPTSRYATEMFDTWDSDGGVKRSGLSIDLGSTMPGRLGTRQRLRSLLTSNPATQNSGELATMSDTVEEGDDDEEEQRSKGEDLQTGPQNDRWGRSRGVGYSSEPRSGPTSPGTGPPQPPGQGRKSPSPSTLSDTCKEPEAHKSMDNLMSVDRRKSLDRRKSVGQRQRHTPCWHEVAVVPITDPDTGQTVLLVKQSEVTMRCEMEQTLLRMTEAQLYLLEKMFPRHILERLVRVANEERDSNAQQAIGNGLELTKDLSTEITQHSCVTILFTDLVGFTTMSDEVQPEQVLQFLNSLFSKFDELVIKHKVSKVETAGDCFIVCAGLLQEDEQGFNALATDDQEEAHSRAAQRVINFAIDMLQVSKTFTMPNGKPVQQRVGMHSGPVACGMIGQLLPKFSLFGDTMNTASRMESTSVPGRIQISEATHRLLAVDDEFDAWKCTGGVEVKGKGRMNTYLLAEHAMTLRPLLETNTCTKSDTNTASHASVEFGILQSALASNSTAQLTLTSWKGDKNARPPPASSSTMWPVLFPNSFKGSANGAPPSPTSGTITREWQGFLATEDPAPSARDTCPQGEYSSIQRPSAQNAQAHGAPAAAVKDAIKAVDSHGGWKAKSSRYGVQSRMVVTQVPATAFQ